MSDRDPFTEGQEAAEALRRGLEALREDVRAVVREEVVEAGMSRAELERLVTDVVRARLAERRPRRDRTVALLVAGTLVGLLAGALGYHLIAGPTGEDEASATDPPVASTPEDPGTTGAEAPEAPTASAPVEVRAARYDSLFESGSTALEPLLADLTASPTPVTEALASWRAGEPLDGGARRRLHDALVQAALNRLSGTGLALDGLVTRNPCGGASCGALLRLWEAQGNELGLPPLPGPGDALEEVLPMVERLVVLRALEVPGG